MKINKQPSPRLESKNRRIDMTDQIEDSKGRAWLALEAYKQAGGVDPEYAIRDLISDLLHVLHETNPVHDVEHEHMMAVGNFLAEVEEN
jgi:hypothetical protein